MFRSSSIFILVAAIFALICVVAQARSVQYDFDELSQQSGFPYAQWAELPHKRVPSAGDMMVRFGKRSI
ncbi:unnamed protein product [Caenorhabditis angaria]|uniref:Uncharacterized protein n=1 Tax=Caenorhabditis angaria TaxID=860376 RepID=A0A9P1N0K2_9PELO|nr:unnamed protein product [Caenorhabditis angaria]